MVPEHDIFDKLPDGSREVAPLVAVLLATAIPVALAAVAAIEGSTAVLVVALLAMVLVGAATLGFIARITSESDGQERRDASEDPGS